MREGLEIWLSRSRSIAFAVTVTYSVPDARLEGMVLDAEVEWGDTVQSDASWHPSKGMKSLYIICPYAS